MKNYLKAIGISSLVLGTLLAVALLIVWQVWTVIPLLILGTAFLVKDDLDFDDRTKEWWKR